MSGTQDKKDELLPNSEGSETALEIGGAVASVIPWIGGPVGSVLTGIAQARKWERIREVLIAMTVKLEGFESEVAEEYVKTEEFQDLLEKALLQSAGELREEKRRVYTAYLTGIIKIT
jgi:hypothetical protein